MGWARSPSGRRVREAARRRVGEGRGQHRARGKLLPRERIEIDERKGLAGTELSPLAAWGNDTRWGPACAPHRRGGGHHMSHICQRPDRGGGLEDHPWTGAQELPRPRHRAAHRLPIISWSSRADDLPNPERTSSSWRPQLRDLTRRSDEGIPSDRDRVGNSPLAGAYIPGSGSRRMTARGRRSSWPGRPLVRMATARSPTMSRSAARTWHSRGCRDVRGVYHGPHGLRAIATRVCNSYHRRLADSSPAQGF